MPNDIVGHIQCLNLLFVAVEELQAYLVAAVLAGGVGYPRDIGVGEQVGIHLVLLHSTQQPVGCRPIYIVEPHAGNNEFGVEEDYIACFPLPTSHFLYLLYLLAGDVAYIVVGVGAMEGGNVVASIFRDVCRPIAFGKILPKTALARTLRSYDTYFEQINFVLETPLRSV